MRYLPLRVSRLFGEPGRRAFGLDLILENKPGALAEVATALAEMKLNIIGLEVSMEKPTSDVAHVFIAIDATGIKFTASEVAAKLRTIKVVKSIEAVEPAWREYLVASEKLFPLLVDEERAVLLPASLAKGMITATKGKLGAPVSGAIRWMQGVALGEALYNQFKEHGAAELGEFARLLSLYLRAFGWCVVEDVEVSKGSVRLRVKQCWECEAAAPSNTVEGHMLRGLLQGLFAKVFNAPARAEEKVCIAKGDEYCEFEVYSVSKA